MTDLEVLGTLPEDSTFRCRKCRIHLFSVKQLASHKDQNLKEGQIDLSSFDKCSSWFLRDYEDLLPWITESVEEAQWTEGKLYCPKCKSRIGAFDFIHGVQCNCGKFIIPAVWIQKCRVDHILPRSQITNIDIRKPIVCSVQSTSTNISTSVVVQNAMDSFDGNVHEMDDVGCTQNPRRDKDFSQMASSSILPSVDQTDVEIEGKDNYHSTGPAASWCNPYPSANMESASSLNCNSCIALERNLTASLQDTNISINQCKQCRGIKLHQAKTYAEYESSAATYQRTQRPSSHCTQSCTCTCGMDTALESTSSTRRTMQVLDSEGSHVQRSKRKRKGRHHTYMTHTVENVDLDLHAEMSIEPQVTQAGDQKTYYSCLTVDEGFDETMTMGNKVAIAEFPDRHCCAVCLDLLYEPFKCSCDHVFCDPCLRQLNFRTSSRGTIKCPLCRQTVEQITPASELRSEIKNTYDTRILRKRERAERRAPYRKWPLPANHGPLRRAASRTQRSVTLPCIISTFLVCACVYTLVMIALLSNLTSTDVIKMY
ncbi:hypothetical protein OS493_003348 [Desmophyllum pertusum]|uniref:RING-type domain-containing protein n=1 Tax=Desmophyllum pertusum TaxID=174260 RepID=A0A9X0DBC2_9CNID|nr:hypothetical protein OS493_003348 [Desmophyllum pertusum]